MSLRFSLEGRILFAVTISVALGFLVLAGLFHWLDEFWLSLLISLPLSFVCCAWLLRSVIYSVTHRIRALQNGMLNLLDFDFSVSLTNNCNDELADVIGAYNKVTETLRSERQYLYQRELLLDTVIQNSSLALILTDPQGRIIYSNHIARHLFNKGKAIQGLDFNDILKQSPSVLRDIVEQGRDGLFSIEEEGEENAYHISLGRFVLNTQRHNLYLIKQMTREINRQEVSTWKKVIRVISHELNNSLAPISSMAHSGRLMLQKEQYTELNKIFETIAERTDHLKTFIDSYASMAKLPLPVKSKVEWSDFIEKLCSSAIFTLIDDVPQASGNFDSTQIEQVIFNLLKNAHESGSEEKDITLRIQQDQKRSIIEVGDRGIGMSKTVMENALLPYYTTKKTGSGIGLPLCREIVEAHDGEISFSNRTNGGLRVRITLPC